MRRIRTQRDSVTDGRRATQYLLRSLSGGEGNMQHMWFNVFCLTDESLDKITREHWIQRITFAAETNAADMHTA